ncbi:MAG: SAV_6107 family HEPN domain-containing protein [Corynebacterium sp.]|nr:SAV_6107 family HEPN domain-containing protein [Corynebacterium sp.]
MNENNIVSATTRFLRHRDPMAEYLDKATVLLGVATERLAAGDCEGSLEAGYQAALRTAGARVAAATGPVRSARGRPQGSVWERLRKLDPCGAAQAEQFAACSRLRSRVIMGLPVDITPEQVRALLVDVDDFIGWVEEDNRELPAAA